MDQVEFLGMEVRKYAAFTHEKSPDHNRGLFYTYEDYILLMYYIRQAAYHAKTTDRAKPRKQLLTAPPSSDIQQIAPLKGSMKINKTI
jgi:hypothetical protein